MIDLSDPYGVRAVNKKQQVQNLEDAEARKSRLSPQAVTYWTNVISHVQRTVRPGQRPCSYEPWLGALREYSRNPPYIGQLPPSTQSKSSALMRFAADIAQPSWPAPRQDLIEFAIVFLEADVMLFQSGYVKRHLIKRLQQSELSDLQVAQMDVLLRRAVTSGTGLEEYRSYAKLAASLVCKGYLPGLTEWLEHAANGAVLTLDKADVETMRMIFASTHLSENDYAKLNLSSWLGQSQWGVVYPGMSVVVQTKIEMVGPSPKFRRNAYLMLRAIRRRERLETMRLSSAIGDQEDLLRS